jgi:hypothetical protein
VDGAGVKILVEAWDGAPFYQVLVAQAESERSAVEAARQHLARKGAVLVSHDPGETTWVELATLSQSWCVDPPSPDGILFESGRIWLEAHFAGARGAAGRR